MFYEILTLENLLALLTLTSLEIILGIDNIVFIAILTGKLDPIEQPKARRLGIAAAMIMRILLLFFISSIMLLKEPFFSVLGKPFSGRDLILLTGGLFLIAKATHEIHSKVENSAVKKSAEGGKKSLNAVIIQIMFIDIIFSLDSVITAVGMVDHLTVMVIAIILSVGIMLVFAEVVSKFVEQHPTLKMLALSFLLLIGVMLVAEGWGQHIERGYIYFAMAFALAVEVLNIRVRKVN